MEASSAHDLPRASTVVDAWVLLVPGAFNELSSIFCNENPSDRGPQLTGDNRL
jgi:hypothetical protein